MTRPLFLVACALALVGCTGGGPDDAQAGRTAAQAQAAPAQKTVLDAQLKALQKAKDVQKTVDDQNKAAEKAIDDQGG